MAKHTIRILNYNLTLTSDDDKTYIENIAERVERNIKTLSDNMPTRNMTEVSLFVAMDYCDRYMKAIGDGNSMRGQIKDYLKDSGQLRQQLDDAKKEIERLKAENEKLCGGTAESIPSRQDAPAQPEVKTEISETATPAEKTEPAPSVMYTSAPIVPPRPFFDKEKDKEKDGLFSKKKSSKGKKKRK